MRPAAQCVFVKRRQAFLASLTARVAAAAAVVIPIHAACRLWSPELLLLAADWLL
jgi:hypothetical protein